MPLKLQPIKSLKANYYLILDFFFPSLSSFWFISDLVISNKSVKAATETPHFEEQNTLLCFAYVITIVSVTNWNITKRSTVKSIAKKCYTKPSSYLVTPIPVLSLINLLIDDREFQLMQTTF